MNNQITAMQYPDVYKELGIDLGNLGCIFLDVEPLEVSDLIPEDELYYSGNHKYVSGVVSEDIPHMTVLYGLMRTGSEMRRHVDAVLDGWLPDMVIIDNVAAWESTYEDDPYYCIVAKIQVTDQLKEGNGRLRFLPHVDTFIDYAPHITLAYIKKDEAFRDDLVYALNERFAGKEVKVKGINYGD